jgi:anti-sigma B factor antagonist
MPSQGIHSSGETNTTIDDDGQLRGLRFASSDHYSGVDVHTYEHEESGGLVLVLRGQLALDTAAELREVLKELLARSPSGTVSRIVVDLSEVGFCDSLGLSAVIDAHRVCVERGGWLRLAAPAPAVARVLDVVGVSGLVPVYDSIEAACARPAGAHGAEPDPPPSAGRQ